METEVNFEEYITRMEEITDKVTLLDYIDPVSTVLDYGCGSGHLAESFTPEKYTGFDIAPSMVKRAETDHPLYTFTSELPVDQKFDVVIFSSLLHEVYSYNGRLLQEVVEVLQFAKTLLTPGGSILIRDGIRPLHSTSVHKLLLKDSWDAQKFLNHLQNYSPFSFPVEINGHYIEGSLAALVHFFNVYTWGWASVKREQKERVNFVDLNEWLFLLECAGLRALEVNVISQEDYFEHLETLVDLNGLRWETKAFFLAVPEL